MDDWNPALGSNDVTPLPSSSPVHALTSLANTKQVVTEFLTLPTAYTKKVKKPPDHYGSFFLYCLSQFLQLAHIYIA